MEGLEMGLVRTGGVIAGKTARAKPPGVLHAAGGCRFSHADGSSIRGDVLLQK